MRKAERGRLRRLTHSRTESCLATLLVLTLVIAIVPPATRSQNNIDSEIPAKIRSEVMERSQIMRTLHYLTDLYGPRLTGSPNLKQAAEWAVKQMDQWGLKNCQLDPWEFGHPGWLNERLSAHLVSPVKDHLVCEALAWTPGTNGPIAAEAYQMVLPESPTQEDLTRYLDGMKDRVKGKIVLVGKHQAVPVNLSPPPRRLDDQQARARYDPNNPNAGRPFGRQNQRQQTPGRLSAAQINDQVDAFLLTNKALVRVNDAARDHGQIRAFANRSYDPTKVIPTVMMRNEDYGRISRVLADGKTVDLEFNIVNRIYPEGHTAYNAVAEIPGGDKGDEVVMLGAHLDSWHAATGATDNAIGCAVMMEAVRILKAIGVKPRRTIRLALWGGEEQGLLGSQAYVNEHFGTFENPKPGFFKLSAYFNIDAGTGRARGLSVFGPAQAADTLRRVVGPFEDLGVVGVIASKNRSGGGSDHASFTRAGLPGISVGQDPIEYGSYTWHTNLDTFERIVEEDVKKSAIVIAAAVYYLAMADDLIPRFGKEEMPAPPQRRDVPQSQPQTPPDR